MPIVRKILGRAAVAATTNTSLYTVPADTQTLCNVNLVNRTAAGIKVRLALSDSGAPADADYIEYDFEIGANSVLERTGLTLDAGKQVVVYAAAVGISAVAYGQEQN